MQVALDRIQMGAVGSGPIRLIGVEAGDKCIGNGAGGDGVFLQRLGNIAQAIGEIDLTQIMGIGADDFDLAAGEAGGQHQRVEGVVGHIALPDMAQRFFKIGFGIGQIGALAFAYLKQKVAH